MGRQVLGQEKVAVQKDFRLELASDLMSCHSSRKKRGRPSDIVRFNERHFPTELTSMRQCKVCSSSNTRNAQSMVVTRVLKEFICAPYLASESTIHVLDLY